MTNIDKERYNELLVIINEGRYLEIGYFNDLKIIESTDLKNIIIDKFINSETIDDDLMNVVSGLFFSYGIPNDENLKDLLKKVALVEIDKGYYSQDILMLYDGAFEYFCEKIKQPGYYIKSIDKELITDEFIDYCLSCNNLSIFEHVGEIDDKYREIIIEKMLEGLGFIYNNTNDIDEEIFLLNLKNGYIGISLCEYTLYGNNYEKARCALNILKDVIDSNKPIINYKYLVKIFNQDDIDELLNYILDSKKYNYLKILSSNYNISNISVDGIDRLVNSMMENPEILNFINFSLIDLSYEKKLEVYEFFYKRQDIDYFLKIYGMDPKNTLARKYIIELLKDGKKINLNGKVAFMSSLIDIFNDAPIIDYEILKLVVDCLSDNIFEIINFININEQTAKEKYNADFYNTLRENIAKAYNLNINHLDIFVKKIGYNALYYLDNENIANAINLDDETFNYYISLFEHKEISFQNIQNIYDAILQARFKIEHSEDISRLERIKESIKRGQVPLEDLKVLANNINIEKIRKRNILTEEQLLRLEKDPLQFIIEVVNKLINDKDVDYKVNMDIIYCINSCYISDMREIYRKDHPILDEVDLEKEYDEKTLKEVVFKKVFLNIEKQQKMYIGVFGFYENPVTLLLSEINYNLCDEMTNEELIHSVLKYLSSGGAECNTPVVVKNIKRVKKIIINSECFKKIYENRKDLYYDEEGVRFKYIISQKEDEMLKILCEINPYELRDTVIKKPEIRKRFERMLDKYKIPFWSGAFDKALKLSDLELDHTSLGVSISKFALIDELLNKDNPEISEISLVKLLNHSIALSSASDRYSILFGETDSRLLKANDKPNDSKMLRKDRLAQASSCILKMYERKKISVPPIDSSIEVNNKKIKVTLGNFTDPINLTYGERTGSCMRIGGVGASLFDFCMTDQDGFHICLKDDETGQFISRVSGFRSGNSIFLNQLRESTDEKYSNEDLIEAIKIISQILIESTKNSNNPIENIFITDGYALKQKSEELVNINTNIQKSHRSFYFDLVKSCIVLGTTAKSDKYAPIKLGAKVDSYDVLRQKPRTITDKAEIYVHINRYLMLKAMIGTKDSTAFESIDLITYEHANSILCLIAGEDFIVYLDSNLEIKYDYIERGDNKGKGEMEKAIEILNQSKEEYKNESERGNSINI